MSDADRASGLLLVVSGPSGAGKTTIARRIEECLGGFFSVSATTRPRCEGEVDGHDYHFMTAAEFQALVDRDGFIEYARVYSRDRYGTMREPVEARFAEGRLVILDIDVQGALQVKQAKPGAMMLFIEAPSEQELLRRLRVRGRDDEASIQRRFEEAKREIAVARASGIYDAFIVNDELEEAVQEACRLVQQRAEVA